MAGGQWDESGEAATRKLITTILRGSIDPYAKTAGDFGKAFNRGSGAYEAVKGLRELYDNYDRVTVTKVTRVTVGYGDSLGY